MNLHFSPFDSTYKKSLIPLIFGLYQADAAGEKITLTKIEKTITAFQENSSLGTIMMALEDDQVIGYAILINYWSNEYGGIIIFIDEFYIDALHRGKGIGTKFLRYLIEEKFIDAVAFALEVMPGNTRALELYKRLGFYPDGRNHLFYQRK